MERKNIIYGLQNPLTKGNSPLTISKEHMQIVGGKIRRRAKKSFYQNYAPLQIGT